MELDNLISAYTNHTILPLGDKLLSYSKSFNTRGVIMLFFESLSKLISTSKLVYRFISIDILESGPLDLTSLRWLVKSYNIETEFIIWFMVKQGDSVKNFSITINKSEYKDIEKFPDNDNFPDNNSNPTKAVDGMDTSNEYMCSICGKRDIKLKKCGKCKIIAYCSEECQRKDWTKHKKHCTTFSLAYKEFES